MQGVAGLQSMQSVDGLQNMQGMAGLQNMQSMRSRELYIFRFLWYNIVIYETGAAYD